MRQRHVALLLTVALAATGCGSGASGPVVERFDAGRVELSVAYQRHDDRSGELVATFRPTGPGIHLYDTGLPLDGIDGAGRPTRIDLVEGAWRTTGPLEASVAAEPLAIEGYPAVFPVYPAGPVTLTLPVSRLGAASAIEVTVTFMACTDRTCFPPVVGHRLSVGTG